MGLFVVVGIPNRRVVGLGIGRGRGGTVGGLVRLAGRGAKTTVATVSAVVAIAAAVWRRAGVKGAAVVGVVAGAWPVVDRDP